MKEKKEKKPVWIEVEEIPRGVNKKKTLLLPNHKFIKRKNAKKLIEKGKVKRVQEET